MTLPLAGCHYFVFVKYDRKSHLFGILHPWGWNMKCRGTIVFCRSVASLDLYNPVLFNFHTIQGTQEADIPSPLDFEARAVSESVFSLV